MSHFCGLANCKLSAIAPARGVIAPGHFYCPLRGHRLKLNRGTAAIVNKAINIAGQDRRDFGISTRGLTIGKQ